MEHKISSRKVIEVSSSGEATNGTYNGDLDVSEAGAFTLSAVTINKRFTIDGATWFYPTGSTALADPSDVREGVSNAGATGTLGGGEITLTVS